MSSGVLLSGSLLRSPVSMLLQAQSFQSLVKLLIQPVFDLQNAAVGRASFAENYALFTW